MSRPSTYLKVFGQLAALAPKSRPQHPRSGAQMKTRELAAEMRAAFAVLTCNDMNYLVDEHGIPSSLIGSWQLIGATRYRRVGLDQYEPDPDGNAAFVTPVLTDCVDTPESLDPALAVRCGNLIDLVAWHPKCPRQWRLRCGSATWLGSIEPQYLRPKPVRLWRTVLRWLQSDCTGLCVLTRERFENFRLLSRCTGGIVAEDELHEQQIKSVLERPWPGPEVHHAA
jgi:hypothetical protein